MNLEVFKQAQSRGWMEGYEIELAHRDPITRFLFIKQEGKNISTSFILSLNDILFGTDFCEKFIGESCPIKDCQHFGFSWRLHLSSMVFMSESERIAFLEKHLEVKEEEECNKNGCPIDHSRTVKTQSKEIESIEPFWITGEHDVEEIPMYMVVNKLNEVISQTNANIKAFVAHVKDCKLNRN